MNFRDVATVNFQGLVVAFARGDTPIPDPGEGLIATNLYFNVLALDVASSSDAMDWTGFKPLTLPDAVRPAGMNMVNVPISYSRTRSIEGLEDADQPFRVATNQEYIYLFRQAKKGTLLVNRLRLVRQTAANNPQEVGFALDPAWEVRFQRSAKPDVPADERDSQSYLSPDRTPFLEPAFELFMIDGLVDGNFDIELLPRNEGTLLTCAVIVSLAAQKRVDVYELPLDAAGLFSLADKRYVGDRIPPDFAYSLVDGAGKALAIDGRPSSAFYLKQERVRGADNRSFTVKRSGRVMIAHRASLNDGPATLATVDLAVAADGHLARPAEQLRVDPVGVANYTLDFDPSSYVGLPSWAPKQHYSVDLWIYPQSATQATQQILGPIDDHDAPYLRLVDGNAIEVGFQGKNGKPLSARTPAGSVRQEAWTRVQVSFDAKTDPKYRVRLNGFDMSCSVQGEGDHPSLGQINAISAPVDGFIGYIDQFLAYDGADWDPLTLVGKFAFDTVDYIDGQQQPLDPPLTPNSHDPSMPGKVHGAHLVPSTSPAVVAAGALSWDDRGLTIYASYFDGFAEYSELASSPFLLSGSDGLLHCYFKGASDAFSVMQLDTEIARSTFEAVWNTAAGTPESGRLQLVAAQPGAFMNAAKIGITPAATLGERFCDLRLESPSGVVETWNGVPRSQRTLAAVLAGDTVADPADARLRTGARGYFDFTGTRSAAYLPLADNPSQAEIAVVSRAAERMPLASIGIEDAGSDNAVVTLAFAPPRWPDVKVSARWPALPRRVGGFLDTLNGLASGYDYRVAGAIDAASYSLSARSDLVAANRVVLFVKPGTDPLQRIAVSPVQNDALLCDVEIQAGPLSAQWRDVPRAQVAFATVLEAAADKKEYDYAKSASGDYAAIGALLTIITDGSDASVQDASLGGQAPVPADDDLRISASLIAAFATATYSAETLAPLSAGTAASCFQSAFDNGERAIAVGSSLFRAVPFDVPTQGAVGVVADTGALTGGIAPLSLQGFNGGWINQPEQRTLGYMPTNWVGFELDETKAPNIGALTIAGDMSLELWCRPERAAEDELQPFQRLLTFSRQPPEGGDPVRYLAALNDCPSLKTAADTRVFASFNSDRGTFYVWFSAFGDAGTKAQPGIIGSIATIGVVQALLPVRVDQDGRLNVSFALDATQPPIVSQQGIVAGDWHQVAVTYDASVTLDQGQLKYVFKVQLYVDGVAQGAAVYTATRSLRDKIALATLVIGDIENASGLPMLVNETAFFGDILSADAIEQYAQQRIADNAEDLVFKWMLIEGQGNAAVNSAVTGSLFDADVTPAADWQDYGLYSRAVLGHGSNVAVLSDDPVIHGWTHLALVHQAGYAVSLSGREYGDAGNDDSLNLGDNFSLEGWVELDDKVRLTPQTLIAKGDDYALAIDGNGFPSFSVRVTIGDLEQTLTLVGPAQVDPDEPTYLAATFETVTIDAGDSQQSVKPLYEVHMALYANGQRVAWGMRNGDNYVRYQDPVQRVLSKSRFNLGRSPTLGGSGYLRGRLADPRIWSRRLQDAEIARVYADRRLPADAGGLVSWWRLAETGGRTAFDENGDNDVTLTRGDLRGLFAATTCNDFYINGAPARRVDFLDSANAIGGYGVADQFQFARVETALPNGFNGQLAEVRIWGTQLTGEQITDSMHGTLSGAEAELRGYWNFSNGSGAVVEDRTGRGNTGRLNGTAGGLPQWLPSTAPLGNEAPEVLNIFGGLPTYAQRDISATPSVIEYADLQRDAYGNMISVMKRAYASIFDQQISLVTGYKTGDLDTVYLGQAQSRPTLVGYIEGAPPLPSENQTLPYWRGGYGEINSYAGASSVAFTEADNTLYAYNASRDVADTHAFSMKGGLYGGGQYSASAGIGVEAESPIMAFETHLGAQNAFQLTEHRSHGIGVQSGTTQTFATEFQPGGSWEPGADAKDWVNPVVGRRYVPSNTGVALVKSLTVDVYASILRRTGSMVKMSMAPNTDIPVDVNLIDFPIDPTYVKNGTLDGKVGLRNDPNYPDADQQRGSYFKPLEAYSIKRRIERDTARLEAYYQQYDPASYAGKLKSSSSYDDYRDTIRQTTAYDWSEHLSKRSIVNTYVWTAGGGRFAEQTQPMNVYSEQHGAVSSTQASLGAVGDIQMGFPFGFYLDFDYLYSSATEVNVTKSKEEGANFELAATARPDSFLYAPILDGDNVTFPETPTEGKVDGYRYQAFMLAPDAEHADTFFSRVVDPNWLNNSKDANAAALREATSANAGPWRVMYRVTYVSRIPPRFQPVLAETQAPDLQPPANLDYNALLLQLVRSHIDTDTPTSLQIGSAIGAVLGTPDAPGPLKNSLPWWPQFLLDSTDFALPAASILRSLREDLLQYVVADYAAQAGA